MNINFKFSSTLLAFAIIMFSNIISTSAFTNSTDSKEYYYAPSDTKINLKTIKENIICISEPGNYMFTGKVENKEILVDVSDNSEPCNITFKNVGINNYYDHNDLQLTPLKIVNDSSYIFNNDMININLFLIGKNYLYAPYKCAAINTSVKIKLNINSSNAKPKASLIVSGGDYAPALGCSENGSFGEIYIQNIFLDASGGKDAPGIGIGRNGYGELISINNSNVTSKGQGLGSGIGNGLCDGNGFPGISKLTIDNSQVVVLSGDNGNGIGCTNTDSVIENLEILNSNIEVHSNQMPAIGGNVNKLKVTNSNISTVNNTGKKLEISDVLEVFFTNQEIYTEQVTIN